ncbi:MAG: hypothetical protein OH318_02860 [Candidatus Parvarchaeota archaeon]|nr:hypothetical protein [Candidatus Rehaiarchaeum fermentans]
MRNTLISIFLISLVFFLFNLSNFIVLNSKPTNYYFYPTNFAGANSSNSSTFNLNNISNELSNFTISKSLLVAFLYAALIGVIIDEVIRHSTLSNSSHAIALIIAAIFLVSVYENPNLISFFESFGVIIGFLAIVVLLFLIPGKGMNSSFRAIIFLIILGVVAILYFNPSLFNGGTSVINGIPQSNSLSVFFTGLTIPLIYLLLIIFGIYISYKVGKNHHILGAIIFFVFLVIIFGAEGVILSILKLSLYVILGIIILIILIFVLSKIGKRRGNNPNPPTNQKPQPNPPQGGSNTKNKKNNLNPFRMSTDSPPVGQRSPYNPNSSKKRN